MKTIDYSIQFYGYWHIGSGLSGGTKADNLVLKDPNNLPFIPGKTIKGLFRNAAQELVAFSSSFINEEIAKKAFGSEGTNEDSSSSIFFSDAQLDRSEAMQLISEKLSENLFEIISSTKINKQGTAEDKSLRQMEVTIPLTLFGSIQVFEGEFTELILKSASMIKYLGLNRNRGLGRCEIKILS